MKKSNIQNILVPIDFSETSIQAIKTAKRLARRFAAAIYLAHVRQFDYASFAAPAPPLVPFSFRIYEEDGENRVFKELDALARKYGISPAICHVLSGGAPFDEICRLAQKIAAGLIVMPTHGRTGLKHVFLGSTAERVVQHSPCPVFVVREKKRQPTGGSSLSIKKILVPVDFSKCSRDGAKYAVSFANAFGSRITLMHATYLGYMYSANGTHLYDVRGLQAAARDNAARQMCKVARSVESGRVKFETAITEGSPVLDICSFAKDHDVDLIITSTHGLTGWQHVCIGSIAEQVVRHAPCSVLVVPSHPHFRTAKMTEARQTQRPREQLRRPTRRKPAHAMAG